MALATAIVDARPGARIVDSPSAVVAGGEKRTPRGVWKPAGRSRSHLTQRGIEPCTRVAQRAFAR